MIWLIFWHYYDRITPIVPLWHHCSVTAIATVTVFLHYVGELWLVNFRLTVLIWLSKQDGYFLLELRVSLFFNMFCSFCLVRHIRPSFHFRNYFLCLPSPSCVSSMYNWSSFLKISRDSEHVKTSCWMFWSFFECHIWMYMLFCNHSKYVLNFKSGKNRWCWISPDICFLLLNRWADKYTVRPHI